MGMEVYSPKTMRKLAFDERLLSLVGNLNHPKIGDFQGTRWDPTKNGGTWDPFLMAENNLGNSG